MKLLQITIVMLITWRSNTTDLCDINLISVGMYNIKLLVHIVLPSITRVILPTSIVYCNNVSSQVYHNVNIVLFVDIHNYVHYN